MNDYQERTEYRLKFLMKKDRTQSTDKERISLFTIIAGNDDLYRKIDYIYVFKNHFIEPECLESPKVDFSSGSKALLRLGFNLYNGYSPANVKDILSILDKDNFELAMKAINIRFSN